MDLKHSKIIELSGGSLNGDGDLATAARAVNQNGYVLKDLCNYIEQLEKRIEELEEGVEILEEGVEIYEDKAKICSEFCKVLKLTRNQSNLVELNYKKLKHDFEIVEAVYSDGFIEKINVSLDSGTAMIRDIMRKLD